MAAIHDWVLTLCPKMRCVPDTKKTETLYTCIKQSIKMISTQHSSNNGKNWQKLSYQKILLAW